LGSDCSSKLLSPPVHVCPRVVRARTPDRPTPGCRPSNGPLMGSPRLPAVRPGHHLPRLSGGCRTTRETRPEASPTGRCSAEDRGQCIPRVLQLSCPWPHTLSAQRHAVSQCPFARVGLRRSPRLTGFDASAFPQRRLVSCLSKPRLASSGSSCLPAPSLTLLTGPPCLSPRCHFPHRAQMLHPSRMHWLASFPALELSRRMGNVARSRRGLGF
jgi:hypothetical protein